MAIISILTALSMKNLPMIFHGQTVKNASIIRIIRSADIEEDDYSLQEHEDYREMMELLLNKEESLHLKNGDVSRSRRD